MKLGHENTNHYKYKNFFVIWTEMGKLNNYGYNLTLPQ